jgi:hypothetical protein
MGAEHGLRQHSGGRDGPAPRPRRFEPRGGGNPVQSHVAVGSDPIEEQVRRSRSP